MIDEREELHRSRTPCLPRSETPCHPSPSSQVTASQVNSRSPGLSLKSSCRTTTRQNRRRQPSSGSRLKARAIFIVHGRNSERKETVARFLRNLTDIEPIIFHEQASGGATLIEKLEKYGPTAGFAVVLATGDDIGRVATADVDADRPRARQNVILELGYFFGVLGREKVVLLYDPGVEIPSDIDGLVYIETDSRGAWKIELTREIEAAGYTVDRAALR